MSNAQGPTHFQTVPPMGQRTPLGGGLAAPLATNAIPAALGGAPVPPMQPSWATGQAAQPAAAPAPVRFIDAAGVDVTEQIVEGFRHGAHALEIQRYYPFAAISLLRLCAEQHGLTLNEAPPAAAPAPGPQLAAAPVGAPIASEKRKRLNKKDDVPRIEQLRKEGANAQQISDAIGLQLASVEKVLAGLEPAAPVTGVTLSDGSLLPIRAVERTTNDDLAEDFSPAPEPHGEISATVERALFVAHEVFSFARDRGISLAEIQAAANLLDVVQPVG